jgi:hypothetical protein
MSEMYFAMVKNLLTCNSCPVLSVEIRVNLVEEIEWRGITLLNGKDWDTCQRIFMKGG